MNGSIYSQHIFLFPFKIIFTGSMADSRSSSERLKRIGEELKRSHWVYKPFKIEKPDVIPNANEVEKKELKFNSDDIWVYNEKKYFHKFANNALFTPETFELLFVNKDYKTPISLYYECELSDKDYLGFEIKWEKENEKKEKEIVEHNYRLSLDHLSLRIFETGIGILTFTLYNYEKEKSSLDDILLINDFGRRIYPQFLGDPDGTKITKNKFLCNKIKLNLEEHSIEGEEFNTEDYLYDDKKFASYIQYLLKPLINEYQKIEPIMDDRMYVLCWYGNNKIISELKNRNNAELKFGYESSKDWYQYIFIDGKEPGIANQKMMEELIKESTYARFIEWDTLYGITRYSFMCLTDEEWTAKNVIRNHMQKMYYQMVVLLLAQRASALKYSDEVADVTGLADRFYLSDYSKSKNDFKKITNRVEVLNKDIILFLNRIWFLEITPQEQGIELYNLAQKHLKINEQVDELRKEVKELYDFVQLRIEKDQTDKTTKLTKLATIFVIPTLIAGLLGMNVLPETENFPSFFFRFNTPWSPFLIIIIIIITITAICYLLVTKVSWKKVLKKNNKN